jgi:hypothetical protein
MILPEEGKLENPIRDAILIAEEEFMLKKIASETTLI